MKRLSTVFLLVVLFANVSHAQVSGIQLLKNFHFGWDIQKNEDYRWNNFYVGTGFKGNFHTVPRAYWLVYGNLNWSNYTLYSTGSYALDENDNTLKTFSVSIPAYVGYNILQNKWAGLGLRVYTGPNFEFITSAHLNNNPYIHHINQFQTGWTIGAGFRMFYFLDFNLAYSYYPFSMLPDRNFSRSSLNFYFGF